MFSAMFNALDSRFHGNDVVVYFCGLKKSVYNIIIIKPTKYQNQVTYITKKQLDNILLTKIIY
jgi:hypothetical protein